MTYFDYGVLAIIGLSTLLSMMRGLIQEILALAAWLCSFWLASCYASKGIVWVPLVLPGETLRYIVAFLAIFCISWFLATILRILVNRFLKITGLKPLDRFLGAGFGLLRGCLLIITIVLLAGMTGLPEEPFWKKAMLSPLCEKTALRILPWLPSQWADHIQLNKKQRMR